MKQIRFGIIEEYLWSKDHNEKSKHPQERLKELGIKIVIGVPESIADCWICLVEDFDFELPPYITARDVDWEYFYHYCPDACKDAMAKCGIDYKPIEDKCKAEKQKEQERINNNKQLFDGFTIKPVGEAFACDKGGNVLFTITEPATFTITIPDED